MATPRKPRRPGRAPTKKSRPKRGAPAGRKSPARGGSPPRRKKAPRAAPVRATPAENPEARALAQRIASLVGDKKALDVVVLDVRGLTSYADYFVVASGESDRQVTAMADHVHLTLKQEGRTAVGTEGQASGNWVLLDYGDVVAHLFHTETRAFYDLEGLWADAPREKVG